MKTALLNRSVTAVLALAVFWTLGFANIASAQRVTRIDAGTTINVRTNETINAKDNDGRVFSGNVEQDVIGRNGTIAIPKGSDVELIVRRVSDDDLALDLDSVTVNGQRFGIDTEESVIGSEKREGVGANSRTGKYVGGGALLGAIIGGIAGGSKGAAIGAGAGAAAGAGTQILTRGKNVVVPSETLLTFRLTEPMRLGAADGGFSRNGIHYHSEDNVSTDSAAYRAGLRAGQLDRDRNQPLNMQTNRWTSVRDRRDYEAGYTRGYRAEGFNNGRQKPSYGGNFGVNIGADRNISWQGPDNARVYVQVDNRAPRLFGAGEYGTQMASFITPGHRYVFILKDTYGNEIARDQLDLRRR